MGGKERIVLLFSKERVKGTNTQQRGSQPASTLLKERKATKTATHQLSAPRLRLGVKMRGFALLSSRWARPRGARAHYTIRIRQLHLPSPPLLLLLTLYVCIELGQR